MQNVIQNYYTQNKMCDDNQEYAETVELIYHIDTKLVNKLQHDFDCWNIKRINCNMTAIIKMHHSNHRL